MNDTKHFSRTGAIIDLMAIRHNMQELAQAARAHNPGILLAATVKADAYGHGACEVANVVADLADLYTVATTDEGIELRTAGGITAPVLILGPVFAGDDEDTLQYGLTQTVFSLERAEQLEDNAARFARETAMGSEGLKEEAEAAGDKTGVILALLKENEEKKTRAAAAERLARAASAESPTTETEAAGEYGFADGRAHIHVAVDTGMSRIGLTPDAQGLEALQRMLALPHIQIDGVFTHFATADAADKTEAERALERFRHFRQMAEEAGIRIPVWHCANTAAIIDGIGLEDFALARVGVGLYGMYPSEEVQKEKVHLQPAMLWYSYLTHIKEVPAGASVSYGYTFTADRPMRIGTVCIGYADGYTRRLSNQGTEVLINGRRCPVLGRICMDQMMVDLSGFSEGELFPGVPVILLGGMGDDRISAEELAERSGTINYEITCNVSKRVPRRYQR